MDNRALKKLRKVFLAYPEHYGSAERFLQLAIEAITDMGNHVVAEEELGVVNSYADVPALLGEKGYIDTQLQGKGDHETYLS